MSSVLFIVTQRRLLGPGLLLSEEPNWRNLAELQEVYPSADLVSRYTVFNIKGNKYRLISRIVYRSQTVFIVAILTHEKYGEGKWKE